jgi:hypothetical protein
VLANLVKKASNGRIFIINKLRGTGTLRPTMMIGTEFLAEIVETAIHSAYLKNSIPISMILIGQSGAGKSKLVMQYRECPGCHITSDITSMGLQTLMRQDHKGELRTIIIPDFNVILSHKTSTLNLTVANLLSVTSEGIIRIDDGREQKETKHVPINIITAMTRDLYLSVARRWQILGFSRRVLPIFYEYSLETKRRVQVSIMEAKTTLQQLIPKSLAVEPALYEININGTYSEDIRQFSEVLAENIGWMPFKRVHHKSKDPNAPQVPAKENKYYIGKQLEFSPHLVLRSMAAAHALKDGRKEINDDDFQFLTKLLKFTKFDRPGEI